MKKDLGVAMTWIGHGTVLYRSAKGKNVLVDPWVDSNPAAPPAAKNLPPIDLMLVTHGHHDHVADLIPIATKHSPDIVCILEMAHHYETKGVQKLHGMNKGGTLELQGIRSTMVHAVHSSSILDGDRLVPVGEPAGFVIEFENGTRVYHAGDTAVFSDMKLIAEIYHPSIAVLPIGDHYTMSPLEAAVAARMLAVHSVLPIHHSTFPALTGTPAAFRKHLEGSGIEILDVRPGETV
ncbi:MAG TPA: metal-dependent hydrolase [Candidatus Limnocylindrales bacterium]|nr:metal-dependent hydrolase [Candidatus Limnocylindrales bacterium]